MHGIGSGARFNASQTGSIGVVVFSFKGWAEAFSGHTVLAFVIHVFDFYLDQLGTFVAMDLFSDQTYGSLAIEEALVSSRSWANNRERWTR